MKRLAQILYASASVIVTLFGLPMAIDWVAQKVGSPMTWKQISGIMILLALTINAGLLLWFLVILPAARSLKKAWNSVPSSNLEYIASAGVWRDTVSGIYFCGACKPDGCLSPMKEEKKGETLYLVCTKHEHPKHMATIQNS